jgi:hypothetical protein
MIIFLIYLRWRFFIYIHVIFAQGLLRVPEIKKKIFLEEVLKFHGGKGFFVEKENYFCDIFYFYLEKINMSYEKTIILKDKVKVFIFVYKFHSFGIFILGILECFFHDFYNITFFFFV